MADMSCDNEQNSQHSKIIKTFNSVVHLVNSMMLRTRIVNAISVQLINKKYIWTDMSSPLLVTIFR